MLKTKTRGNLCAQAITALLVLVMTTVTGLASCAVSANAQTMTGTDASPENASPQAGKQATHVRPVRVFEAASSEFVHYGVYLGQAEGVATVGLTTTGGRVTAINASEGDRVTAGESLASIDADAAQVKYRTAAMNERLAEESYVREQRFLEQGNSFQLKVDQAHLNWLQSQSALIDAERQREAALAITPISGTVLSREIELHQELDPGEPTFRIGDLSQIRISVGIPEADIAQADLWSGAPANRSTPVDRSAPATTLTDLTAEVIFPAIPDMAWEAEIERVSLSRSDQTLTYEAHVLVDNTDFRIRSGQTAQVHVPLKRITEAIIVPTAAIFTQGRNSMVMVVSDNATIDKRVVQPGPSNETYTVIDSGVDPGDWVVREGMNRLVEGDAVEVVGNTEVAALHYAPTAPHGPRVGAAGAGSATN